MSSQAEYIKSLKASLKKQQSFSSPELVSLNQHDEVTVLEKKGIWVKVKTKKAKVGWLPKLVLSKDKKVGKNGSLLKNKNLKGKVRLRSSAFVTAGAARGLQNDKKVLTLGKANPGRFKKVQSFHVSPKKVIHYVR